MYSLRRRTATDVTRKIGPDAAKRMLNHNPDSVNLQLFYADLESTTDLTAITLDEDVGEGGHSKQLVAQNHPIALNALTADSVQWMHGPALNAMMAKIIQNDPPVARNEREQKNYRRRVREAALKALLSEESLKLRATMTTMDFTRRVDELNKSETMEKVFEMAGKAFREQQAAVAPAEEDVHEAVDPETGFYKLDNQDVAAMAEDDIEDQVDPDSDDPIPRNLDEEFEAGEEEDDIPDLATNIPYITSIEAFMELLMHNTMSQHTDVKNNPIPCTLCQEDDTVDDVMKVRHNLVLALVCNTDSLTAKQAKRWDDTWKLDNHVHSMFHSRLGRWKREAVQKAASHPEKRLTCPLCEAVDISHTSKSVNQLVRHVRNDTVNAQHERLRVEGGWYDDDFVREWSNVTRRKADLREQKKRRGAIDTAGHRFSSDVELEAGIRMEGRPGVILGGVHEDIQHPNVPTANVLERPSVTLPERYKNRVRFCPVGEVQPVPMEPALQPWVRI